MSIISRWAPDKRRLLHGAILFVGYVAATGISYSFYTAPAVFPIQSGVALAGLVLGGIALWPAVFLAALLGYTLNGGDVEIGLILAVGNTLQAVAAAYILGKIRFSPRLERMRDVFSLMMVALFASTIVPTVGLIGYTVREAFGGPGLPISWGSWWVGHIWSLLIIAPFLIRWIAQRPLERTRKERLEIALAFTGLLAINYVLFFLDIGQVRGVSLVYLLLVPLFWIALRFGMSLTTLAVILTSLMAIVGISAGVPVPEAATLGRQLFSMALFLEVIAAIFFILAAVTAEKRRINAELGEHVAKLESALQKIRSEDEAKNEFIATLAHELRNPLAPLSSSLELLALDGAASADFPETVAMMRSQVGTMARLLDDLLDISRISRQKLQLQKDVIDIAHIIARSVTSTEAFMHTRGHTLTVTLPPEPLLLEADPVRLEQILVNLLNNAAKYTEPGGRIEIAVSREESDLVIRVEDNGMGIPEEMIGRIFEPFLQAHARHGNGGIGIGLSLTRRLVELHGGTIEARSGGEGHGSEFIVRLPLRGESIAVPAAEETLRPAPGSPLKILIVDDNEAAAEALGKLLGLRGHEIRVVFGGRAALTAVPEFEPHTVLLDIGLADVSGYEIARTLREEQGYRSALVALSGFGQERDKEEAKQAGFDYHLTKPASLVEVEEVLAAVRRKLEDQD